MIGCTINLINMYYLYGVYTKFQTLTLDMDIQVCFKFIDRGKYVLLVFDLIGYLYLTVDQT